MCASHHRNLCCWPSYNQARIVGLSTHSVVSCSVRVTHHNGKLRYDRITHGIHHFSTIFNYPSVLGARTHHETCYILQKHQWYFLLIAVGNEAAGFIGRVGIDNTPKLHFAFFAFHNLALIGNDTNRPAINTGIATYNGLAETSFVFFKLRVVCQALNDVHCLVGLSSFCWHDAVEFFFVFFRSSSFYSVKSCFLKVTHLIHNATDGVEAIFVIFRFVIGYS